MKQRNERGWRAVRRGVLLGILPLLAGVAGGGARADEVRLRSGRTLEITSHAIEEGQVRLTIEGGGEIVLPVAQILEIRRSPGRSSPASGVPVPPPVAAPVGPGPVISDPRPMPASIAPVPTDREALRTMAAGIARRHSVDERLVLAVIEVESHYDTRAVSPRGAVGLMQLMPQTATRFDVSDPYDPAENIDGGVRYLKELLERYSGQVRLVLAAYNAGEEAVEKHSGIPPYRETIQYVSRVLRAIPR